MPVTIECDPSEISGYLQKEFHRLWYGIALGGGMVAHWRGARAYKCPMDLWVYQEIIVETKPDIIIECGTHSGGSALFMADVCALINHGSIITIDMNPQRNVPDHPRIRYIAGSSVDAGLVATLRTYIKTDQRVMVILDSDHHYDHVLAELNAYHTMVSPGHYLIVEDTNFNGHPILPSHGPGPMEAVGTFLREHPEFEVDHHRERFLLTSNPLGYLRRKA
jgi:cephalosporin hydroxylase